MKLSEFEPISRAKRGLLMLRELKNSPHRFISLDLADNSDIIHIATNKDVVVDLNVANLRVTDRYSNGSFVMDEQLEGVPVETWLSLAPIAESTVE